MHAFQKRTDVYCSKVERGPPKDEFKKESKVEHTKPRLLLWHLRHPMSTDSTILYEGKKRTWTAICRKEGDTL